MVGVAIPLHIPSALASIMFLRRREKPLGGMIGIIAIAYPYAVCGKLTRLYHCTIYKNVTFYILAVTLIGS